MQHNLAPSAILTNRVATLMKIWLDSKSWINILISKHGMKIKRNPLHPSRKQLLKLSEQIKLKVSCC